MHAMHLVIYDCIGLSTIQIVLHVLHMPVWCWNRGTSEFVVLHCLSTNNPYFSTQLDQVPLFLSPYYGNSFIN